MNSLKAFKRIMEKYGKTNSLEGTYNYFLTIKKDLEILEILKYNLYIEKGIGRFAGIETIECSLGSEHSGVDFIKVKEWLKNV